MQRIRHRRTGPASASPARDASAVRDDRGALTLFLVIMFVGLLAFTGLIVDAGTKLDDYQNAATYAQEAARAGAGQVNQSQAYSSSTFVIDPAQAVGAAQAYLAALPAGVSGTVRPVSNTAIQVTVTVRSPTRILSIIGIDSVSATSTATATLVSGVTGPGS